MSSIVNSPDVLAALRRRKRSIKKKLNASRTQMTQTAYCLAGISTPKTRSRMQTFSNLIINGIVIYKGYRFCSGVVSGTRTFLSFFKRRK